MAIPIPAFCFLARCSLLLSSYPTSSLSARCTRAKGKPVKGAKSIGEKKPAYSGLVFEGYLILDTGGIVCFFEFRVKLMNRIQHRCN